MEMSYGDVIDRLSIAILKMFRTDETEPWRECIEYCKAIHSVQLVDDNLINDLRKMLQVNGQIWDLEAAVRQGKLDDDLMEVGKRAIAIRERNKVRVELKNKINERTTTGFIEIKKDHASE